MSLGVIPIFWFEFLSDFWKKSQKGAKKENCANQAFVAAKVPQRRLPRRGVAEGKKWPPTGSLQRSNASPLRSSALSR